MSTSTPTNNQPRLLQVGIANTVQFGTECTVVQPSNLYGCKLGNKCFVGPFVEIQKDVTIGDNTRIQSHSFICSLVEIGANCFIAHGVMFVNDTFSHNKQHGVSFEPKDWKATKIGNNVAIGSNATIMPVTICDNVVIGSGSVVTRDITEPGVYKGVPARKAT